MSSLKDISSDRVKIDLNQLNHQGNPKTHESTTNLEKFLNYFRTILKPILIAFPIIASLIIILILIRNITSMSKIFQGNEKNEIYNLFKNQEKNDKINFKESDTIIDKEKIISAINVPPEEYEVNIFNFYLKNKHPDFMNNNTENCPNFITDRLFVNGLIRIFKPKKLLEVVENNGCISAVILNAIKDIKGAFLYSIEEKQEISSGDLVSGIVPELKSKYKEYKNGKIYDYIEQIGKDIEFVFFDTKNALPYGVLNFLQILPFLKENAVVTITHINAGLDLDIYRTKTSNNILFLYLKGKKIFSHYKNEKYYLNSFAGVIMEKDQKNYLFDYFWAISIQWNDFILPKDFDKYITFLHKYYDQKYIDILLAEYRVRYKLYKKKYPDSDLISQYI